MPRAAEPFGLARAEVIPWNGPKRGMIGLDHDRDLVARIAAAPGVAATASALALEARLAAAALEGLRTEAMQRRLAEHAITPTPLGPPISRPSSSAT